MKGLREREKTGGRTPSERLLMRQLSMSPKRPHAPREVRFSSNLLTWKAPQYNRNVTHYRVRIDTDGGEPDFELPSGQRSLQLFRGATFYVTSYNSVTRLESSPSILDAVYGVVDGNVNPAYDLRGVTITSIQAALSDPNDFGVRWWKVTVTYSPPFPLANFAGVQVFIEDPEGDQPEDRGFRAYVVGDAKAVVAFETTAEARTVLVRLYPSAGQGVYNTGNEAEDTIELGPVTDEGLGVERCDNVTAQSASAGTPEMDANGVYRQPITVTFTKPSDPRWAKIQIVAKKGAGNYVPLGETESSGTKFLAELPSSVVTWRIFFRSGDRSGRWNSLNEGPSGTVTPYYDVSVGSASGTFNAGRIQQNTLASNLQIAAGALGIAPRGVTAAMVAEYTLTGGEIADLAINRAAIIGLGIITEAHVSSLAVFDAFIQNLSVDKITGWSGATINVGAGLLFSDGVGVTGVSGSQVTTLGGSHSASVFDASTGLGAGTYKQYGTTIIDASGYCDLKRYSLNGTICIDTSRNGSFVNVDATGVYKMDGTEIINTSKQFIGDGVVTTVGGIGGVGFNVYQSGWYYGVEGPSTFTTADSKTVTVRGGIIVSIA